MLLVQQIEDAAYKHTDARRIIGEFLLSEKQQIEHYSMGEIAEKTFTSKEPLIKGRSSAICNRNWRQNPSIGSY